MKIVKLRCGFCGKFISEPADSYIPFGGYLDTEPPDPVFVCDKCVEVNKEKIREKKRIWNHWQPANYEWELAKELGLVRLDGQWIDESEDINE